MITSPFLRLVQGAAPGAGGGGAASVQVEEDGSIDPNSLSLVGAAAGAASQAEEEEPLLKCKEIDRSIPTPSSS